MSNNLAQFEGTPFPSYFNTPPHAASDFLAKLAMRFGRVVAVVPPDSGRSRSKRYFEYDVLADITGEHTPQHRVLLHNCIVLSSFGSGVDYSRWTPRVLEEDPDDPNTYGTGSRVFVAHINGSAFGGVIIGGPQVAEEAFGQVDKPAKGHHGVTQFNGVRVEVDHLGQLHVLRQGAQLGDGKRADDSPAASKLQMLKSGNIRTEARQDHQQLADRHVMLEAGSEVAITSQGQSTLQSKLGGVTIKSPLGVIKTTGLGVHLGGDGATDFMVMGTTYRAAETGLHAVKANNYTMMAAYFTAAALAWGWFAPLAVIVDPTGTLTTFAASASVAAGTAASTNAAAAATIASFESLAPTYLSKKHRLGDLDIDPDIDTPMAEAASVLQTLIDTQIATEVARRATGLGRIL